MNIYLFLILHLKIVGNKDSISKKTFFLFVYSNFTLPLKTFQNRYTDTKLNKSFRSTRTPDYYQGYTLVVLGARTEVIPNRSFRERNPELPERRESTGKV